MDGAPEWFSLEEESAPLSRKVLLGRSLCFLRKRRPLRVSLFLPFLQRACFSSPPFPHPPFVNEKKKFIPILFSFPPPPLSSVIKPFFFFSPFSSIAAERERIVGFLHAHLFPSFLFFTSIQVIMISIFFLSFFLPPFIHKFMEEETHPLLFYLFSLSFPLFVPMSFLIFPSAFFPPSRLFTEGKE